MLIIKNRSRVLYAHDTQVQFARLRGSQEGDRVRSNASGSKHSEYTFVLFGHE
ncbi:hypothetical protein T08_11581 [Trichinella sp. T8]|nr:hypothetical protein T08_11581 [Trichinella sp. T8]